MNKIDTVLADYETYLKRHRIAKPKHIPYLVKWVRRFLAFAKNHSGKSFDEVSMIFGAELGKDSPCTRAAHTDHLILTTS